MSPRAAPSSTSAATRTQLRANELADPTTSARNLNDVLRDIYARLEALGRVLYVTLHVVVDAGGNMSPTTIQAPAWEVRSITVARSWSTSYAVPTPDVARCSWQQDGSVLTVSLFVGDVSPSVEYDVTFEVRG